MMINRRLIGEVGESKKYIAGNVIMIMVTILMSIGFFMMGSVPVGRVVLAFVWLFHIWYFSFRVKNYSCEAETE